MIRGGAMIVMVEDGQIGRRYNLETRSAFYNCADDRSLRKNNRSGQRIIAATMNRIFGIVLVVVCLASLRQGSRTQSSQFAGGAFH